jgi:hypothetical protein
MNFSEIKESKTVDHLIQDLEDSVITPEDRVVLMDLMRKHASVRERYLQYTEMTTLLHDSAQSRAELGTIPVSQQMLKTARRRSAMSALTYGLAAVLLVSVGMLIFQVSQRPARENTPIVLESSEGATFSVVYSERDDKQSPRNEKNLQAGDQITLDQGLLRFTFPSGVEAVVEGPSQLVLKSDLSVKMDRGQAWFRVPEAGHGFAVLTKQMKVIDLGTEFGVRFNDNGALQVHVAKGRVKVDPVVQGLKDVELVKGEAMTFDEYSRGTPIQVMASLFQTKFTTGIPYLHWSFDRLDEGHFQAEGTISGASEYQAELRNLNQEAGPVSGVHCQTAGPFGKAFSMKANGLFAQTTFPGIGGTMPRTVVAWVRHRVGRDYSKGASYCSWGNPAPGQRWGISMRRQNDLTLSTSTGRSHCGTPIDSSYLPDRWIHVASVYTGKKTADGYPEIHHYINGERQQDIQAYTWPEEKSKPLTMNTDISSEAAAPLSIGTPTANGDLDELYLFRGTLSEPQIRQLMEENRVDAVTR